MKPTLFLHIPKTAGTTLRHALTETHNRIMPVPKESPHPQVYPVAPSGTVRTLTTNDIEGYDLIMGHYTWGHVEWVLPQVQAFTFLRHPVDRFISHYQHLWYEETHPQHAMVRGLSLAEFMIHPTTQTHWLNTQTRFLAGRVGVSLEARHLEQAKRNLRRLHAVGLTEYWPTSMRLIGKRLGIDWPQWVYSRRMNTAQGKLTFTPANIQAIVEANHYDAALYREALHRFVSDLEREAGLTL